MLTSWLNDLAVFLNASGAHSVIPGGPGVGSWHSAYCPTSHKTQARAFSCLITSILRARRETICVAEGTRGADTCTWRRVLSTITALLTTATLKCSWVTNWQLNWHTMGAFYHFCQRRKALFSAVRHDLCTFPNWHHRLWYESIVCVARVLLFIG